MRDIIFTIIVTAIIAVWFAEITVMPLIKGFLCKKGLWYKSNHYEIKVPRRIKPFDCPECLGFWSGLIVFFWQFHIQNGFTLTTSMFYSVAFAICTSLTAVFISKHVKP